MEKMNEYGLDVVQVRLSRESRMYSEKMITRAEEAVDIVGRELSEMDREVIAIINCASSGQPINVNFCSIGSLNGAMACPREVIKSAILSNAAWTIMMHNHPSGRNTPSSEDIASTKMLKEAYELIGIPLEDHIIVGGRNGDFYSFREHGLIFGGPFEGGNKKYKEEKAAVLKENMEFNNEDVMRYETFRKKMPEAVKSYMPEEYRDWKIQIQRSEGVNVSMDLMFIYNPADKEKTFSFPAIRLNNMYDMHERGQAFEDLARAAADVYLKNLDAMKNLDLSMAKDNITLRLIGGEQNREFSKNVLHRPYLDMTLIYEWINGSASLTISNSLANQLGLTESEMFKIALENTRRLMPPSVMSMSDMLKMLGVGDVQALPPIWVISNEKNMNGAVSIIYEDIMHELSEKAGSDLYILPSSVHEAIAVPTDNMSPEELADIVYSINMNEVSIEERLSNQVYFYDRSARSITIATDTPNKLLDGMDRIAGIKR